MRKVAIAPPKKKPKAYQSYEYLCRIWLVPYFGDREASTIGPADVEAFQAYMAKTPRGRETPPGPKTINKALGCLSSMSASANVCQSSGRTESSPSIAAPRSLDRHTSVTGMRQPARFRGNDRERGEPVGQQVGFSGRNLDALVRDSWLDPRARGLLALLLKPRPDLAPGTNDAQGAAVHDLDQALDRERWAEVGAPRS